MCSMQSEPSGKVKAETQKWWKDRFELPMLRWKALGDSDAHPDVQIPMRSNTPDLKSMGRLEA